MSRIMVVDDEIDTVTLLDAILEINGFESITFTSAKEALEELNHGKLPDLLLLDMRMPEISGPDFCEKVRKTEKLKKLKIVFFTASSDLDKSLLEKHGVLGFIFKPFDNDQLVQDINKYVKL